MYFPSLPLDLLKDYIIDHPRELAFLAFDLALFGISSHYFNKHKRDLQYVEECRLKSEGVEYVYNHVEGNRTFGIVQGTVTPIGRPLQSLYDSSVKGVVHRLTITQHNMSRNSSGFWGDYKKVLDQNVQTSPFYVINGNLKFTVQDPLLADRLDLAVTHDKYVNTDTSALDLMLGIVSGNRQRGIQTTEDMLRVGSVVNIIGEIIIAKDGSCKIVPPRNAPYFIITDSVQSLLNHLDSKRYFCKTFAIVFGSIAAVLLYIRTKEFYLIYQEKKKKVERERKLKASRKQRRAATRDQDIIEELRCVVCQTNGREIVLMPCGHFSLCEDCSDSVHTKCPMCRTVITDRIPTYL